jgi:hypothetical protein
MHTKPNRALGWPALILALGCLHAAAGAARAQVEAVAGEPFGVVLITIPVPPGEAYSPDEDDRFMIAEQNGRALYTSFEAAPVRRVLRQILNIESPLSTTAYFLFRGDAPLELTIYGPEPRRATVRPVRNPAAHRRLLEAWWREYSRQPGLLAATSDEYPPLVENYLTATLARRMNLPMPARRAGLFSAGDGELEQAVGLILGTESIRATLQLETLLDTAPRVEDAALLPLPAAITPPVAPVPLVEGEIPIEPIAMHAPAECFYVRFGTFTNYLWLSNFQKQWGGDLQNMIALRGIQYDLNNKLQKQLSLRETVLSQVLGPTVISDVALVGTDLFVREGASIGVMFQARNNFLLGTNLRQLRTETLNTTEGATEETVSIGGRDVSYLSTPSGSVRSYYVVDGDYHFISTSSTLVRRFLEAGAGQGALGADDHFRHARTVMPLAREDAVFAFLSDEFFAQMIGPAYRVEMTRRMQAAVDIEQIKLARLASRAEGLAAHSVEELTQADLLPANFARRGDGSRPVDQGLSIVDSLRGQLGYFTPIADVPVEGVTAAEQQAYERFARYYRAQVRQMGPVMVGLQRTPLGDGLDRMTVEMHGAPIVQTPYGELADLAGPATTRQVLPIPGDLVSLQAVVQIDSLLGGRGPVYHLFGGLRDQPIRYGVADNRVQPAGSLRDWVRGYIGAWPRPGLLEILTGGPPTRVDRDGYAPLPGELGWQRRTGDFFVFSFRRDVIGEIAPHLGMVNEGRPAQVRLRIEELGDSSVAQFANALAYQRARQASQSGSRLMNALADQLHVAPADARGIAEDLLGGSLVCSLGGDYDLVELPSGQMLWTSTALPRDNRFRLSDVPADYTLPLLTWFRGLDAELALVDGTLSAFATLDMQNKSPTGQPVETLPLPGLE